MFLPGFADTNKARFTFLEIFIPMDKKDFWPKEGKLKKGLIILALVLVAALVAVLIQEKYGIKLSSKVFTPVVVACIAIWAYRPTPESKEINKH